MHLDAKITLYGGNAIGWLLMVLGWGVGSKEVLLTGIYFVAAALLLAFYFDWQFAEEPVLKS